LTLCESFDVIILRNGDFSVSEELPLWNLQCWSFLLPRQFRFIE